MGSKDELVIPVLNSMDQSELPPLFVKLSFDKSSLAQAIWQVWSLIEMINRSFGSGEEGWFEKKQLDVKKVENEKATWNYYLQCWLEAFYKPPFVVCQAIAFFIIYLVSFVIVTFILDNKNRLSFSIQKPSPAPT
ncbi:uncharacterized protein LOC116131082 [Pistacia vera]|uniref:uncharacterized protein LOC116131082 n=1 Tax=Pistacia vera TaxID=55513 RepID=UPI001262F840|nr:uncharacterized protein LOC116131082 [Pistacia vera]